MIELEDVCYKRMSEKIKDIHTYEELLSFEKLTLTMLENGLISHDEEYVLYNEAFENVYNHPAFDENGNFWTDTHYTEGENT